MVRVAIADLLDRLSVGETALAMSELADECIRTALDLATRFLGERARASWESFASSRWASSGARELNLSSDVDLIYLHEPRARPTARKRLRAWANGSPRFCRRDAFESTCGFGPAARFAPLVTPIEGAINYYQSLGQTWERAALLRARPVAGDLEIGLQLRRRAESFYVSQLPGFRHAAPVARDEASDRGRTENARDDRTQHQARPRRNPRARIYRAGAHADLRRTRSAASNRADRRRAREAGRASATCRRSARANSPTRTCSCATSSTSCKSSPGLQTHVLPATEDGMRALAARMGFGKGRASAEEIQRATEISSRAGRAAISRDARRRRRRTSTRSVSAAAELAWNSALDPDAVDAAICASSVSRAPKKARGISNCSRADLRMPRPVRGVASCSNASARC